MPTNQHEMIEEIRAHIRKAGGESGEWRVGTAEDARGPFFQRHRERDLGDGLAYREAYTTSAADAVLDHLVKACGLRPDPAAALEPGRLVFVYHQTSSAPAPPASEPPPLAKLAA